MHAAAQQCHSLRPEAASTLIIKTTPGSSISTASELCFSYSGFRAEVSLKSILTVTETRGFVKHRDHRGVPVPRHQQGLIQGLDAIVSTSWWLCFALPSLLSLILLYYLDS